MDYLCWQTCIYIARKENKMNLCSRCKKNPAVFYITKMEGNKTSSEGLCLSCAKELGIAPLNQMIENFGVSDDELDNLNSQMSEFMESLENMEGMDTNPMEMMEQLSGGEDDEGGAATAPLDIFKEFFGNMPSSGAQSNADDGKAAKEKKSKKKHRIFLLFC